VEEVGEAWTWRWRRRVVSTMVPERGGKGLAIGTVPLRFDMEEEQGADVEAHAVEGARWRQTRRRSGHRRVCGGEMKGLGFRGSDTIKYKNSSNGYDNIINARRYCGYAHRYRFLKIEFRID
jgi:hypothetical protein